LRLEWQQIELDEQEGAVGAKDFALLEEA